MYLSDNCRKLLVIYNQTEATIYKMKKVYRDRFNELASNDKKESEKIEWVADTKITQFPQLL